jgi:hypothetical protein
MPMIAGDDCAPATPKGATRTPRRCPRSPAQDPGGLAEHAPRGDLSVLRVADDQPDGLVDAGFDLRAPWATGQSCYSGQGSQS